MQCVKHLLLLAGKYAIEAESVRKRTHSVTATCRDASRGSKVSLLAAFYISEEDYQEEVAARGTLPSNLPIPSKLAVHCRLPRSAHAHVHLSLSNSPIHCKPDPHHPLIRRPPFTSNRNCHKPILDTASASISKLGLSLWLVLICKLCTTQSPG